MSVWIAAALLTFAACMAIAIPFMRARPAADEPREHDLEVYRDQLAEVDRDAERGLIAPAEAEEARAEIGRRMLRLDATGGQRTSSSGRLGRIVATIAILAVPVASWGLYAVLGSPDIPDQPLQERLAKNPSDNTIEELVARAERHLAANPDDGKGWQVLAPIYMRLGRYQEAVDAYRKTIQLLGDDAERQAALGEAIAAAAGGTITDNAQAAFDAALKLDPNNPRARFYLATGLAQDGRTDEAKKMWQSMMADLPDNSPWKGAAGEAIASVDGQNAAPGPSSEDMQAAASMSSDDRKAMIETMVSRLDQKLRDNPADPEGWKRLIRSYVVLGEKDKARDALARGVDALTQNKAEADGLVSFAASLGIEESGSK